MKPSMYFKDLENKFAQKVDKSKSFIVRLDGCGFSKWTQKNCDKPFDNTFAWIMSECLEQLMKFSQSCKYGYTHSDEMSLLFENSGNPESSLQYDGKISKICSIYSSVVTAIFNAEGYGTSPVYFDCRVFNLESKEDIKNYFLWRYENCQRNSVQALADHHFSSKQLFKKSVEQQKEMLLEIGVDWNGQPSGFKFGSVVEKTTTMRLLDDQELLKIPEHLRELKSTELVKRHDFHSYSPEDVHFFHHL